MARPLEFDRETALGAALRLFWRQGYSATSLNQLLDAMQISRSSFYAAFGDKRALFCEVLQTFRDRTLEILRHSLEQVGAAGAIPDFYRHTILEVPPRRAQRGCMMVNTILELAEVDNELSREASRHLSGVERYFEECVREAQASGALPKHLAPAEVARYLMLINQGLRVACREGRSRRELAEMINTSMSLLGLPAVA